MCSVISSSSSSTHSGRKFLCTIPSGLSTSYSLNTSRNLRRLELPSESILKTNKLGIFYGVLGALGQASGLVLAKFAFEAGSINGFVATFVRLLSAAVIIFPLALVFKRYKNPIKVYTKNTQALWATLVGTILGPVLGITGSLIAIANAQIGIASTLMSTMPIIMLPIVRYYYKEKLSWRAIVGAMIAVVGVAILFLV